jgi:phage-related protein
MSALWGVMAAHPIALIVAAIAALVAAFSYCWNNVKGFKEFFMNAWEAIKQGVSNAADWIRNAIQNIGDWFANLGQNALNWGRDLIQNFINGIKQMWENAKRTVSDFAQMIKNFLGFSEPKEGPLSNFHTYAPDIVDLFVKGLKNNQQLVANQLAKTFGMPEAQAGTAQSTAGSAFTAPITPAQPAQAASMTPLLVLDGQVIGRVFLPHIRDEEMRLGIQIAR